MGDILLADDKGETSALVFLDYTKAIDNTVQLVRKYLNYIQLIVLTNATSKAAVVERGDSLFFIIFTGYMFNCFGQCSSHRYADEAQIHTSFIQYDAIQTARRLFDKFFLGQLDTRQVETILNLVPAVEEYKN